MSSPACAWCGENDPGASYEVTTGMLDGLVSEPGLYVIWGGPHDGKVICGFCTEIPCLPNGDESPGELAAHPGWPVIPALRPLAA